MHMFTRPVLRWQHNKDYKLIINGGFVARYCRPLDEPLQLGDDVCVSSVGRACKSTESAHRFVESGLTKTARTILKMARKFTGDTRRQGARGQHALRERKKLNRQVNVMHSVSWSVHCVAPLVAFVLMGGTLTSAHADIVAPSVRVTPRAVTAKKIKPDLSHCYTSAAASTTMDPALLRAIADVESGGRPYEVNRSHYAETRSIDIGLMQINSGHLPRLNSRGVTEERLLNEPCLNALVGAEILRDLTKRHGLTWRAVGAYNTACVKLKGEACEASRMRYVTKVHRSYSRQMTSRSDTSTVLLAPPPSPTVQRASTTTAPMPAALPLPMPMPYQPDAIDDWTKSALIGRLPH